MKYTLVGTFVHKQTSQSMSTIEYPFESYTQAKIQLIEFSLEFPNMKWHIDFNKVLSSDRTIQSKETNKQYN